MQADHMFLHLHSVMTDHELPSGSRAKPKPGQEEWENGARERSLKSGG